MNHELVLRLNQLGVRARVNGTPQAEGMTITCGLESTAHPFDVKDGCDVEELEAKDVACTEAVTTEIGITKKHVIVNPIGQISFRIRTSVGSAEWLPDRELWVS